MPRLNEQNRAAMADIMSSPASAEEVLPLRVRYRAEANGQIVHDSLHRRAGWTESFLLHVDGAAAAGFGSIAVGGPWTGKPTLFEFYLLPEHRLRAFELFEHLLDSSGARFFEVQTSDALLAVMLHTYGRDIVSEKIVFRDDRITALPSQGAVLKRVNSEAESRACFDRRQGGSEWALELGGQVAATGGILFHYNMPYCDVYMEVAEPLRRRGLGSYFVQEMKRVAYEMGGIPAARCSPDNVASRRTLQKAGFVPYAHILVGEVAPRAAKPGSEGAPAAPASPTTPS
jgi:GNAT superfamily N-acetyltransferase